MELTEAIQRRDVAQVRQLLAQRAFVDVHDGFGRSPLVAAAGMRRPDIVSLLLGAGAVADRIDGSGIRPLNVAIYRKDAESAALLLQAGANVNTADLNGWTPLMHAVNLRDQAMVRLLVRCGADTSISARDGTTAGGIARWRTFRISLPFSDSWWELVTPSLPWSRLRRALRTP